jgi:hypothetical protein
LKERLEDIMREIERSPRRRGETEMTAEQSEDLLENLKSLLRTIKESESRPKGTT